MFNRQVPLEGSAGTDVLSSSLASLEALSPADYPYFRAFGGGCSELDKKHAWSMWEPEVVLKSLSTSSKLRISSKIILVTLVTFFLYDLHISHAVFALFAFSSHDFGIAGQSFKIFWFKYHLNRIKPSCHRSSGISNTIWRLLLVSLGMLFILDLSGQIES